MRCASTLAAALLLLAVRPAPAPAERLLDRLLIVAPAAPGGGWDQTARAMQHALEREGLVRVVEVQNVAGAAGTIGLAQFVDAHHGDGAALLVTGLVMLGATIWNESPVSLAQVTPMARLTDEYEVIAVPAGSPHRDLRSLVESLRGAPGQVSWGGGSAGGTDHILAGLIGAAAGVDPRRVNYIAFSGGGEAVAALLGGNVTAGVSGYSEFAPHVDSGRLRALAVSAPSPVPGLPVPTLREQGLDVHLTNWRAVVAAPGLSTDDRARLASTIERMARSATWRKTLAERAWIDAFEDGEPFEHFLSTERVRIARIVSRLRGASATEPIRSGAWVFPSVVSAGAVLVLIVAYVRRRPGMRDRDPAALRPVLLALAGLAAFLLLLRPLGFVVAASATYTIVACAFGHGRVEAKVDRGELARAERHHRPRMLPTIGAGVLFSAMVYLAFTRGLDLELPAGAAWTWIR